MMPRKPNLHETNYKPVIEDYIDAIKGRSTVLLYHDFSDDANGSPSGRPVDDGGVTWTTSGTVPPTVTGGKLNSNGSGYLYTTLPARPVLIEVEASFGGSVVSNSSLTIAFSKTAAGGALLNDIAHLICGPSGASLQMNKDNTGGFDFNLGAEWPQIPLDGTKCRIGLEIQGDRATIIGPDGSTWTTVDRRISNTLGSSYQAFFVQAQTSGSSTGYIHGVTVLGEATTGRVSLADRLKKVAASVRNSPLRLVGAPNRTAQVSIGGGVGGNSINPTVGFGTASTGQDSLRAILLANASIGATSIQLDSPLYGYSTVTIGYGTQAETVAVSGTSGSSSPYTITVGALAKAHTSGEPVTATTSLYRELYLDLAAGGLVIPGTSFVNGTLELGFSRDTGIRRSAAGTVEATGPGGNKCGFKTASGTTAQRPAAGTVGAGFMYFDTTLGYLITSNGSAYVNGAGTVV